jgi:hypothetical protein
MDNLLKARSQLERPMPRSAMHIAGLLLGLAVALGAQSGRAADWIAVTGDGKFAIQMPAPPEAVQMPMRLPAGSLSPQARKPTAKSSISSRSRPSIRP